MQGLSAQAGYGQAGIVFQIPSPDLHIKRDVKALLEPDDVEVTHLHAPTLSPSLSQVTVTVADSLIEKVSVVAY